MERPGNWRPCPLREWGPLGERRLGSDGRELAEFHFLNHVPDALRELITSSRTAPKAWLKLWGMTRLASREALATEAAPGIDARKLCELLQASGQTLPTYVAVDIARAVTEAWFNGPGAHHVTPDRVRLTWTGEVRLSHDLEATLRAWGQFARPDPHATPPEVIRGFPQDPRTAVYSVGVLLLMLLTRLTRLPAPPRGESPRSPLDDADFIERQRPGLKTVLERALLVDADARFDTPAQLRERLAPFAGREGETQSWLSQHLPKIASWELTRHQLSIDLLTGRDPEPLPPELEARLLDHPEDEDAWAVLGDHLMARGSPRGELAEVQRRLEASPSDAALKKHEQLLLEADARLDPPRALRCEFHRGYVRKVEVGPDADLAALEEAMAHPSLRFLHTLKVTQLRLTEPALSVLVAAKHRAVRRLELPVGLLVDEKALRAALPRLEAIVSHQV
ncbi:MAG: hypothetical protein QM723_22170 [Myxococcaceae bacterium]